MQLKGELKMKNVFRVFAFSGRATFLASLMLTSASAYAVTDIDQEPLLVQKQVPGNMAIIGSFEFPTMVTRAYRSAFSTSAEYVGYFDSQKCYKYNYSTNEPDRYFYPVRVGSDCNRKDEWSGQFLNWSTMQSIDIFRYILTGGYRHLDTPTETVLEKGTQTGQGNSSSNFPDANISSNISVSTPATWSSFKTRIGIGNTNSPMGNSMRFTAGNFGNSLVAYDPSVHGTGQGRTFDSNTVYEVSVRVKVCVQNMLEANCKRYSQGAKPEGLIQANSDNMRYSAFGYLNDNSSPNPNRDGGIMHARMKYVGPESINDQNNAVPNANAEWDADTGVFFANPDPADANATTVRYPGLTAIEHSGVISYINNSGLIVPGTLFKRYDNVSELFYTAYRYLKGLPNRSEYINITQTGNALNKLVGGLPIIDWSANEDDDPMQFSCQKNFFLGIGDTNTHPDTRVPKSDDTVDLAARVGRISTLEGGLSIGGGRSALIAGLAFDANTADMRPDLEGMQTASTYWIDILEGGDLKGRKSNQYWLAAKYGGLKIPDSDDEADRFNPNSDPIEESWWYTNGETLNSSGDKRPDNFYVVASAQDLVDGLVSAFADIQKEQTGNRSSLALNSTTLEAGSATFQAEYTTSWDGDLNAFSLDENDGTLTAEWSAASVLPDWDDRNIKTLNGSNLVNFVPSALSTATKNMLASSGSFTDANAVVNYLRGEETTGSGFRVRGEILGDIIDSQPVYVGEPNSRLFRGQSFAGSSSYASWASSLNRTPVVYVGANDGMLHGFNASINQAGSGVETFAYVPKTVIENGMGELASPDYEHRYYVDGELTVADAWNGSAWRTVLVGTLGYGGVAQDRTTTNNAIFALDVTDPDDVSLLWEKSSAQIPALGINQGKPVIAQVADGVWSVLLGNGHNSASDTAALIGINLFTGNVTTTQVSATTDNGLSAVRAWDSNGDGLTDIIYAGDLQGSLWKFTGLANSSRTALELFQARDPSGAPQPITSSPLAGRSPYSQEVWLFFGTGSYVNTEDLTDMQVQSWYGIDDKNTGSTITRSNLLERKILLDSVASNVTKRVIEAGAREDLAGKSGWFIDLYQVASGGAKSAKGERMVTPNQFQSTALISNTRIPDASDPCNPTGRGVIMAIDPFTGARLADTFFDSDRNGTFDNADKVLVNGVWTVVSGIGLNTGFSNPSFLDKKMYTPTDDGDILVDDINPPAAGAGRTSWRELINLGN